MSTVFMMRFNRDQAAVVADESTWHLGVFYDYRRTNYGDAVMPLYHLDDGAGDVQFGLYAGLGFPSFHFEVAERSREAVAALAGAGKGSPRQFGDIVSDAFARVHRRYVDDRLLFHLGIGMDHVNAGEFSRNGNKIRIGQPPVLREAKKVIGHGVHGDPMQRIFDNEGAFLAYDRASGVTGFTMGPGYRGPAFSSLLTVLGHNSMTSNLAFSKSVVEHLSLDERRAGLDLEDGLFNLMLVASETFEHTNKMGGYFQILLLDMRRETRERRVVEICDHRSRLAHEIMKAHLYGFVDRHRASALLNDLLLGRTGFEAGERDLFAATAEPDKLRLRLMGFKVFADGYVPKIAREKV